MPILLQQSESGEVVQHQISKDRITIGRRPDNDIVLYDGFVSRYHATIDKKGDRYFIADNNSTFGTFVNEERITEREIKYGDSIRFGTGLALTFVDEATVDGIKSIIRGKEESPSLRKIKNTKERLGLLEKDVKKSTRDMETREFSANFMALEKDLDEVREDLVKMERSQQIASTLYEIGKVINFVFDLKILLNMVMEMALKVVRAERGFIMLKDEKSQELVPMVARNMDADIKSMVQRGISQTIAGRVAAGGEPVLTVDASLDPRFKEQQSVVLHGIRSVMCVPLRTKDQKTIGVIYVDGQPSTGLFDTIGLDFLTAFSTQASIAIEQARLYEKIRREERIRSNLQRYLAAPLVNKLLSEQGELALGGEHKTVTIVFVDIRGFTTFSEKMAPKDVVELLNEYFTVMTEEVFKFEGTLDKFMGDCIMALYGAPFSREDDALRAVKTAVGMKKKLKELKEHWKETGRKFSGDIDKFDNGIGINTGDVIAGNIGSSKRMEYTVIGDAVNLASRIQGLTTKGQIMVSEYTYAIIKDKVKANQLPPVTVKGKAKPINVYEILDLAPGV